MRAWSWLKDLCSSERGNVLVIGAATLPLLIGSAAFAVDTIQLSVWKRQLQRAADSGAIAGAYALSLGDDEHDAVHRDLDKNRFPTLSQEEGITVGPRLGFNRTVRVTLTATRSLPFMSIFTNSASTIVADATAALVDDGTFCMVSLYDGEDPGIDVNGNANVTLGCGMKSNCIGEQCVTAGGSSSITAVPIAAVGGLDGDSQNFVQPTTLQPYSAAQQDPLAHLPNPSPDPSSCTQPLEVPSNTTVTLAAGDHCYSSITVHGTLNLTGPQSTLTAYGGNIVMNAQAQVTGTGVTLIMTGPAGAAGDLQINGGANLNLSSPSTGTYRGIVMYRDRRASNIEIKINGGASSSLTGALYFPSSDLAFEGNQDMDVECLQMVAQRLVFRGSATITNNCPSSSGASAFQQTVVRLVA
ncbi:MAG TPA: Tad domain-containing protein [Allosphingosinicella sp.]|nr:Tad domain-containing protein [Allosphingosinicella sp.]